MPEKNQVKDANPRQKEKKNNICAPLFFFNTNRLYLIALISSDYVTDVFKLLAPLFLLSVSPQR